MERWIQAAKDEVMSIVRTTQTEFPDAEFQTAFVGYRDYGDTERFILISFTNPADMLRDIRNVHAEGGGDMAEDVATGLQHVSELDWSEADVRAVVHIADAPAHGRAFHGAGVSDRYPGGDPSALDPCDYIRGFAVRNIDYTFVKINDSTDKMLDAFMDVYTRLDGFKVLDLRPQRLTTTPPRMGGGRGDTLLLSPAVSRTITASISRYTCSQDPVEV
jgi:hypothetical protein